MKPFFIILFFLAHVISSHSQGTFFGSDTVCANSSTSYSLLNSNANNTSFSVINGTIVFTSQDSIRVSWGSPNSGLIQVVLDSNGYRLGTLQKNIHIKPLPLADIMALNDRQCIQINDRPHQELKDDDRSQGCFSACSKGVFKYFPKNYNPNHLYHWEVDSASSWSINNDTLIVNQWGSGYIESIKLVVQSIDGCIDSSRHCVYISENPEAKFYHAPSVNSSGVVSLCLGGNIALSNLSEGAFKWSWQIIDMHNDSVKIVSTEEDFNYTFREPGLYMARLIAWNHCNCTDTAFVLVDVNPEQGPEIECTGAMCENGTFIYRTSFVCPNSSDYNWKVSGNGTILNNWGDSIEVQWLSGPKGFVSLALSSNCASCTDTTSILIPIIPSVIPIYGPTTVCAGEQSVLWTDCWPGGKYRWMDTATTITTSHDIGLGIMPQPNYWKEIYVNWKDTIGVQTVDVKYKNKMFGCEGVGSTTVAVKRKFNIEVPEEVCQYSSYPIKAIGKSSKDFDVYITGASSSGPHATNSSGIYNHYFSQSPGEYKITMIAQSNDYCIDTVVKYVQVMALPPAPDSIYGEDSICVNQGYEYQCNSVDGHTVHWIVNNGSPTASSGSRIGVKWGAMGPRKIGAYLVKNSPPYCSSDTIWRNIYPKTAGPVAISGAGSVCPSTELSYTVNADVDAYVWTVSGGSIIHGQNSDSIVVLWDNNSGSAQITLDLTACVFYPPLTYPVTIINPPSLQISPADPEYCLGESLNFSASFSSGSATSNYLWYENGSLTQNASSNSYSTSFASTGTKAISVKCINSVCADTLAATKTFTIISPPKAQLSLKAGALDDCDSAGQYMATLNITKQSGPYAHNYPADTFNIVTSGVYSVLITDTITGCISSSAVSTRPCSIVSCSPVDTNYAFNTFFGSSCNEIYVSGAPSYPTSVLINGDTASIIGTYTVKKAGFYEVVLLPDTCHPPFDTILEVPIVADFEYSFECNIAGNALITKLKDRTTYTDSALTSWSWSINGGVWTSSLQNPSFTLPPDSCFSVIFSANACSISDTICTPAAPLANFNILSKTPVCEAFPVEFQDASSGFIISHLWNFDGTKYFGKRHGAMATFDFQAPAPHSEIITLTIEDMYGCKHSQIKSFETKENDLDYRLNPTSVEACEKDSFVLVADSMSGMNAAFIDFLWNTGDTSKSIILNSTGKYILSVVDSNRCIDNDPANNIFRALFHPLPEVSIAGDIEICKLDMLDLLALGDTNLSYTWFDTIFTLGKSGRRFQRFYPYAGPNTVKLQVENPNTNCISENNFSLFIHPEPDTPSIVALPDACMNDKVISLIGTHPNASNLQAQWSDGSRGFNIDTYERGSYWLSVTDSNGCSNTSLEEVLYRTEWCYFPCGCYEFCDDFPGGQPFLFWTGIPPDMADWRFIVNGFSDTVPPYAPPIIPFYYPDSFALDSHGVYNIQMVIESGNYCIDTSCTATITLVSCDSAGGGSLRQLPENGGSLVPYPNPNNMQLDLGLKYDLLGKGPWKLEVIGSSGQVLTSKVLQNKSGNESINLEKYPPGVYQIRTTSLDGKRAFQKVILIQ